MFTELLYMVWISPPLVSTQLELLMNAHVKNQLFMSPAIICLSLACCWSSFWLVVSSVVIASASIARAYAETAVHIMIAYGTLLVANTRYISLIMIPITILAFTAALFVKFSKHNGSLNHNEGKGSNNEVRNKNGSKHKDGLYATAVLPACVLFLMARFGFDSMVVSQFLLFLTSTLGELTLLMERLPSEARPAFRVTRRASLVVGLVTAHAMAAELLGDEVVLACTPELIAGFLWFSVYYSVHAGGSAVAVSVDMITSSKAPVIVLSTVMAVMASYLPAAMDGPAAGKKTILLSMCLASCAFSVVLLSLCVFTLREWPTATMLPSSEMERAIQLLIFSRDIMLTTAAALFVLVFTTQVMLDGRLSLQELYWQTKQ